MSVMERSAVVQYRRDFDAAFDKLARSGQLFNAEQIVEKVGRPPGHHNLIGALFFAGLSRWEGRIKVVGFQHMTRPESHGRRTNVYRGRHS